MTIEEYTDLAKTATAENFQTVLTSLLEGIKTDFSVVENLNNQVKDYETKIRDLQDTNQKLFLSQTSKPVQTNESEIDDGVEGIQALDAMSEVIKSENSDKTGLDILS